MSDLGTPIDGVMDVIELLAKESVGNDKKVVELIKIVSEGAHKGDDLLLEGINTLAKTVEGLITTVKALDARLSMLESKETKH